MMSLRRCCFSAPLLKSLLLGCAVALWTFCLPAVAEEGEAGHTGKLFSSVLHHIALEYQGTVTEVLVVPGDKVRAGQVLARFRLKGEAVLDILTYLERQTIRNWQIEIAKTEKEALSAKEEYETARRLSAAHMGSAERLSRLKKTMDLLQRQKTLYIQSVDADTKALQAKSEVVQRKLGKMVEDADVPAYGELISPLAGEVVYVHPSLREGMIILDVLPSAVTVARTNPMEVRTRVFEADIPDLRIGGKAKVKVISLDNRSYDGKIASIDRNPEETAVDRPSYYGVRIEIPNDDGKLRIGFKTTVDFVPEKNAP